MKKNMLICLYLMVGSYAYSMTSAENHHQSLIAEALQSEMAFTHASDQKPIVATYGCGPCVAVGGYDKVNKSAFVVHVASPQEIVYCGKTIFEVLYHLAHKKLTPETPIIIHLRGGQKGFSETTIAYIKKWMTLCTRIPMILGSERILYYNPRGESLSIDSRTGTVNSYDPGANPHCRTLTDEDIDHAESSYRVPNLRIAYMSHFS